ncbi:hypothetical protein ZIOFF_022650 [Zingiber officinale]|uniref:Protein FAR1-RELATED SEQUENCE n=1 Tax=Zingiber officinale TaxID=94328 RepID=A0A8J5H1S8_ZINOF|nr:hypothetical protein ZIOFF_022650 [Zingiber officinale]
MEQELLIEGDVQVLGDSSSSNTLDTPQVGMYFSSEEEIRSFYKSYAQGLGFGISKLVSKKGDDGQIKYFSFGCSKNGKTTMERTRSFEKPIDLLQMHADLFKEGESAKMNFEINDYPGYGDEGSVGRRRGWRRREKRRQWRRSRAEPRELHSVVEELGASPRGVEGELRWWRSFRALLVEEKGDRASLVVEEKGEVKPRIASQVERKEKPRDLGQKFACLLRIDFFFISFFFST